MLPYPRLFKALGRSKRSGWVINGNRNTFRTDGETAARRLYGGVSVDPARDINVVAVHYAPLMIPDGSHRGWAIEKGSARGITVARGSEPQRGIFTVPALGKNGPADHRCHHPLYRNPKRENKFTWIAKVHVVSDTFNTTNVPIHSLAQARRLEKIGVVGQGTAMEDYLTAQGFTKTSNWRNARVNAGKLAAQGASMRSSS